MQKTVELKKSSFPVLEEWSFPQEALLYQHPIPKKSIGGVELFVDKSESIRSFLWRKKQRTVSRTYQGFRLGSVKFSTGSFTLQTPYSKRKYSRSEAFCWKVKQKLFVEKIWIVQKPLVEKDEETVGCRMWTGVETAVAAVATLIQVKKYLLRGCHKITFKYM